MTIIQVPTNTMTWFSLYCPDPLGGAAGAEVTLLDAALGGTLDDGVEEIVAGVDTAVDDVALPVVALFVAPPPPPLDELRALEDGPRERET
jgi:hypothetical protein